MSKIDGEAEPVKLDFLPDYILLGENVSRLINERPPSSAKRSIADIMRASGRLTELLAKDGTCIAESDRDTWIMKLLVPEVVKFGLDLKSTMNVVARIYDPQNWQAPKVSSAESEAVSTSGQVLQLDRRAPLVTAAHFLHQRYKAGDGRKLLVHYQDDFYRWTGTHYAVVDEARLRSELWPFLEAAFQGENPFQPNTGKVNEVINALKAAAYLDSSLAPPCWLPDDNSINDVTYDPGEILACRNGLLDLRSQTLLPHTPQFFTLNALDFPYTPAAPAPSQWLRFLDSLWGDDTEAIRTLQEMFGYFLSGDMRHQKAFMIIGPKRGGKGTIARILRMLLGHDNVIGPTLASLSETFGLEPLIGKRVAIVSDARLGGRADQHAIAERLLSISGEDALTIGRKFKKAWTGRLPVRFLILSNMLPRLADASGALASRFILLTMQKSFFGREDHGLTDRLTRELPGIMNWALAGWSRLTRRGYFVQPKSSADEMQMLEDLTSPIAAFIRERCAFGPGHVSVDDLFSAWVLWCNRAGTPSGSKQTFGRDLSAALPQVKIGRKGPRDSQVRVYEGIELR